MEQTLYPLFVIIATLTGIGIYTRQNASKLTKIEEDVKKVQENVKTSQETFQKHLRSTQEFIDELKARKLIQDLPPVDFLSSLIQQWDFYARLATNRTQKAAISHYIAKNLIKSNENVILDSGSTVDLIPKYLVNQDVKIYTNNIFAVVGVSGISNMQMRIYQLPGFLDYNYAATYPPESDVTVSTLLSNLPVTKIIIATKVLNFDGGIHVSKDDKKNRAFKKLLLKHQVTKKFIIAVDWTKFRPARDNEIGVLQRTEWETLRKENKDEIIIVTHRPPEDVSEEEKTQFNDDLTKFKNFGFEIHHAG